MEKEKPPLARRGPGRAHRTSSFGGLGALGLGLGLGVLTAAGPAAGGAGASVPALTVTKTAGVTFNMEVVLPNHSVTTFRGNGVIDFAHEAMAVTVTVPPSALRANAATRGVAASGGSVQVKGTWVDGTGYLTLPANLAARLDGSPIVAYPVPTAEARAISASLSKTAVAVTYAHLLVDTLAGSGTHPAGTRLMSGVKVHGTEVDLTVAELLDIVPAMNPVMGQAANTLSALSIPTVIWTDSRGRMVEAAFSQPKSAKWGLTGTVRFSGFNHPVSIVAPPAASVRAISKGELAFVQAQNPFADAG